MRLRVVFTFLRCLVSICLLRPFGNIIFDISNTHNGSISIAELRKLEKLYVKVRKAELDIQFLKNCQYLKVTPKFLSFNLPHTSSHDTKAVRKRLLRGALRKRNCEIRKLQKELDAVIDKTRRVVSSMEWFLLIRSLNRNAKEMMSSVAKTHAKKLSTLTENNTLPFQASDVVRNLSSCKLSDDQLDVLKHGLTFGIEPRKLNRTDIFVTFELILRFFTSDLKKADLEGEMKSQLSHMANSYYHSYKPSKSHLKKHHILQSLKRNKSIVILKPDKGNAVVILDRSIYNEQIYNILRDETKFSKLSVDPTITRQTKLQTFLRRLKKFGLFSEKVYEDIYPSGAQPARIYGLPKIHKVKSDQEIPPFRPIISSLGTYNYNLSKWLVSLLGPLVPDEHSTKDTFTFISELKKVDISEKFLVSYDVVSLFTNIPLRETIDIAVDLILKSNRSLKVSRKDLVQLFMFATAETHFIFDGAMYDQIDGVAMGSPLGPVLANLFMSHHENGWIKDYNQGHIHFYRRYVDDIFAVFDSHDEANKFLEYINSKHPNIKFTMEVEVSNCLAFLDVLVTNSDKKSTSVFRKLTFTGLLTNFFSYTGETYKIGLIKNQLYRAYHISSSWQIFHDELSRIYKILLKNSFPRFIIDRVVKNFIEKQVERGKVPTKEQKECNDTPDVRYFKLPYRGKVSELLQAKLDKVSSSFCKTAKAKIAFLPFKIGQYFSPKDPVPKKYKSNVVYQFVCAGCNAMYIGETTVHYSTRIHQHFNKGTGPSAVYKHLGKHTGSPSDCRKACDDSTFRIIDEASTKYALRLKEGMHIRWHNEPVLNKQVRFEKIQLSV